MEKHLNKKNVTFGFILTVIFFIGISLFAYQDINSSHTSLNQHIPTAQKRTNYFSYAGKNGQNALTLLKDKTTVIQDHSGLVISINGRKADNTKHEYWAFYVNGKYASVGPATYVTKDGDKIEWKIEKY